MMRGKCPVNNITQPLIEPSLGRHNFPYTSGNIHFLVKPSDNGVPAAEGDEDCEADGVDGRCDVEDGDPAAAGHLQNVSGEVHAHEPFQNTIFKHFSFLFYLIYTGCSGPGLG